MIYVQQMHPLDGRVLQVLTKTYIHVTTHSEIQNGSSTQRIRLCPFAAKPTPVSLATTDVFCLPLAVPVLECHTNQSPGCSLLSPTPCPGDHAWRQRCWSCLRRACPTPTEQHPETRVCHRLTRPPCTDTWAVPTCAHAFERK